MLAAAVPGLSDRMLAQTIRSGWAAAIGHDLARRSRPGEIQGGVLDVTVDNSPWLCEMTLRSDDLLGAVRSRFGAGVTSLKFSLGRAPTPPERVRPPRPSPPAHLSAEEERSVETIAAAVSDPELAASLRRLMTKDLIARRRPGAPSPARRENT